MKIVQTDFFQDFRMIAITMAANTIIAPLTLDRLSDVNPGRESISCFMRFLVFDCYGKGCLWVWVRKLARDHIFHHANANVIGSMND